MLPLVLLLFAAMCSSFVRAVTPLFRPSPQLSFFFCRVLSSFFLSYFIFFFCDDPQFRILFIDSSNVDFLSNHHPHRRLSLSLWILPSPLPLLLPYAFVSLSFIYIYCHYVFFFLCNATTTSFDVIDSADLSQTLGILNILTVASPLLKATPHATLRTDLLRKSKKAPLSAVQEADRSAFSPDTEDGWCTTRVHECAALLGE